MKSTGNLNQSSKLTAKKIILSLVSGFIILILTFWIQFSSFTFSIEDGFFNKLSFWKYKILSVHPRKTPSFVFVNTGKDLAIVDDTVEYGNVSISDRKKLYDFLHQINNQKVNPLLTVIDLQLYYPYSPDLTVDSLLQLEVNKQKQLIIPLVKTNNIYKVPIIHAQYGFSDYETYNTGLNKFRLMTKNEFQSVPIKMQQMIEPSVYTDYNLFYTCNGKLALTYIYPSFYLKDIDIKKTIDVKYIKSVKAPKDSLFQQKIPFSYFNLGELLLDMETNPENYLSYFKNKILIIGNFDQDTHITQAGIISGPLVITNIFLSVLNKENLVSWVYILILYIVFSFLSYISLFGRMPEVKLNFKFLFSPHLVKFLSGYISYFGSMFILSVISVLAFNIQMGLFLPTFIYTAIEYVRNKKYLPYEH